MAQNEKYTAMKMIERPLKQRTIRRFSVRPGESCHQVCLKRSKRSFGSKIRLSGIPLLLLFFSLLCTSLSLRTANLHAQCAAVKPFTVSDCGKIHDIFDFTFLQFPSQNRLDSLVFQLNYPMYVRDSSFYKWPADLRTVRSPIDVFDAEKVVREMGKLKTPEAFFILQLPWLIAENASLRSMHDADDLSPFNNLLSVIPAFGGAKVLNEYYLQGRIDTHREKVKFEKEVIDACKPLRKEVLKKIRYCIRLQGNDYQLAIMRKSDPAACDSAVVKVIRKYLHSAEAKNGAYSLDSIMLDILQLPNIEDAENDRCIPATVYPDGTTETNIGVLYKMPARYPWDQYELIERSYRILRHHTRPTQLTIIGFTFAFLTKIRTQCNE